MKQLGRVPDLEAVELFKRLDDPGETRLLSHPERSEKVKNAFGQALDHSLNQESRVLGWRMQSLFSSLVVALDECELVTFIDTGEIFYNGDEVKPPDFFLHIRGGRRILVDVKSHKPKPSAQNPHRVKFSKKEINGLRRFGDLYGAEVFLAIRFPGGHWTLNSLDSLITGPGGGFNIDFGQAMTTSQMFIIGDKLIGTTPSIEVELFPQDDDPAGFDNETGTYPKAKSFEVRSAGNVLKTSEARNLALYLQSFGSWEASDIANIEGSKLVSITRTAVPEVRGNENENFEMIGSLSYMFSRQFELATSSPEGPIALGMLLPPEKVARLIPKFSEQSELPIWQFSMVPSEE